MGFNSEFKGLNTTSETFWGQKVLLYSFLNTIPVIDIHIFATILHKPQEEIRWYSFDMKMDRTLSRSEIEPGFLNFPACGIVEIHTEFLENLTTYYLKHQILWCWNQSLKLPTILFCCHCYVRHQVKLKFAQATAVCTRKPISSRGLEHINYHFKKGAIGRRLPAGRVNKMLYQSSVKGKLLLFVVGCKDYRHNSPSSTVETNREE